MKIVHIATSYNGGAGRAAWRLHQAMLTLDMNSVFLSIDSQEPQTNTSSWKQVKAEPVKQKKRFENWFKIGKTEQSEIESKFNKISAQLKCETASLPISPYLLHQNKEVRSADIINLHWVSGMLDYASFFEGVKKPVCWTMHDMQSFEGLFHYQQDKLRNQYIANDLNYEILQLKKNAIESRNCPLHLVSPSAWLLNLAMKSPVMQGVKGSVIPYSLDLNLFKPTDKHLARVQLKLPEDKFIMLFISKHLLVPRKGYQILHQALEIWNHPEVILLVLGNDAGLLQKSNFTRLAPGAILSDEILVAQYAAADAVIIPSEEDNLPNVMLEAMACGRPVISFPTGGMLEHIRDGENGTIAKEKTVLGLKDAIERCYQMRHQFKESIIREYAKVHFEAHRQAAAYINLYRTISEFKH